MFAIIFGISEKCINNRNRIIGISFQIYFQGSVCTPEQLKCVDNVNPFIGTSIMCPTSCNGLMVTGFTKFDFYEYSEKDIQSMIKDYKNYKKCFKFPFGIKG